MSINKSQGQSLKRVGLYLPEPIFGHGQLYVALSRATSPGSLKILMKPNDISSVNTTSNIVYTDLLRSIELHQVANLLSAKCLNYSTFRIYLAKFSFSNL